MAEGACRLGPAWELQQGGGVGVCSCEVEVLGRKVGEGIIVFLWIGNLT